LYFFFFFFFKQKTAYEIDVCDWSSDVCSSDLLSADDRTRLAEWLALQIAAATDERALALAARIDEALVARVRRALPARVEALAIRGRPNHIVAA